jgi:hypothetical protein
MGSHWSWDPKTKVRIWPRRSQIQPRRSGSDHEGQDPKTKVKGSYQEGPDPSKQVRVRYRISLIIICNSGWQNKWRLINDPD